MTLLIPSLYTEHPHMLWRLYEDLMNTRPGHARRQLPLIGRLKHGPRDLFLLESRKSFWGFSYKDELSAARVCSSIFTNTRSAWGGNTLEGLEYLLAKPGPESGQVPRGSA